jgi:hypothetical protein
LASAKVVTPCHWFAQLTWRESLRELEECLNAKGAAALYHLGLLDGYMVFYCTVLQTWLGDPDKVKPVPAEADAWDARRAPHLRAKECSGTQEVLWVCHPARRSGSFSKDTLFVELLPLPRTG